MRWWIAYVFWSLLGLTLHGTFAFAFLAQIVVVAIWLVGAAVTRHSLERMAYYTPIAVVVVGATVGLVVLWVKVIVDSIKRRRSQP